MYGILVGYGTVDSVLDISDTRRVESDVDARRLLAAIAAPNDDCLVIDPSLITPAVAESIADILREFPRPLVAYSSVTTAALDSAVVLARRTDARFVFRGTANEQSALQQALLLTPDVELRVVLLSKIEPQMSRLPLALRHRLREMFLTGDGVRSLDALAMSVMPTTAKLAHGALLRQMSTQHPPTVGTPRSRVLTRRTLDRQLGKAGFVSGKRLLEAARVISGYSAVTAPRVPLKNIARMLGYTVRTMNAQFMSMLGVSCTELRRMPLSPDEVAERLAKKLTEREG